MKRAASLLSAMVLWAAFLAASGEQTIDVDLSACNRAMTYAQMTQVCRVPADYDGKVFRLNGKFNYSQLHEQAKIIIGDTAGCCEIAIVFQPSQALTYPDDYPPLYANILLTARWGAASDGEETPYCFYDAVIDW